MNIWTMRVQGEPDLEGGFPGYLEGSAQMWALRETPIGNSEGGVRVGHTKVFSLTGGA